MPFESSICGCVDQSLHTRQCVRFVDGAGSPGHVDANEFNCVVKKFCSDEDVQFEQLVFTCNAISNPSVLYWAAAALLICVFVYTYDVPRTHSQSATEQPFGLTVL